MNRPGVGPQQLRGMPTGFGAQQQIPQTRNMSSRLPPSGKMASNGGTWAFGAGVPLGGGALPNSRPNNAPMTSFAQTIGGPSQQAPLDPSEFPSLSNQSQNLNSNQASSWATAGIRNAGSTNMRSLQTGLSQQQTQQQQDDLFSPSSQIQSGQGFRFSNQNAGGQPSQGQSNDRPPSLLRNLGSAGQSSGLGFGSTNLTQQNRGNGLLNALSGSARGSSNALVGSGSSLSGAPPSRSPHEGTRQGPGLTNENDAPFNSSNPLSHDESAQPPTTNTPGPRLDGESQQDPRSQSQDVTKSTDDSGPEVQDPLNGMSDIDKWGLKGFSYMMNNFPDYAALVTGADITNMGMELTSSEPISTQIYSLWDNEPPRPAIPRYTLPECYRVHNVASLDSKMSNFNDEALIFMFYSNPGDIQQVMAAQELHNRNWRYHKKLQLWLTKDDLMVPQVIANGTERGYYIFFDIKQWHRERREFTLVYDDLETLPNGPRGPLV
ncbi:NOT2 family protein-like protein [Xylogone sp. PMI_703]|nr:NOT2 family protein-like protein [Xylogone sp. PMI_703]